jgi:hypothetical protein
MDLAAVTRELVARQPIFHRRGSRMTRAEFEAATADDFWEVGASGSVYERERVWRGLGTRDARSDGGWDASEFRCRAVGPDTFLRTYLLRQEVRLTRRLTVWERADGQWRIVYHQGTIVSELAA